LVTIACLPARSHTHRIAIPRSPQTLGANDYDLGHHDAHSFLGDEPGLYVTNSAVRAELPGAVQSLGGVPIEDLNAASSKQR
jgi:hypothetical protein